MKGVDGERKICFTAVFSVSIHEILCVTKKNILYVNVVNL